MARFLVAACVAAILAFGARSAATSSTRFYVPAVRAGQASVTPSPTTQPPITEPTPSPTTQPIING